MAFRLDPGLRGTREQSLTALLWLQAAAVFFIGPLLSVGALPRQALQLALLLIAVASSVAATESGFGDIVPVHPFARSLVTLEAVLGQVYIATLIGLLVSAYANRRLGSRAGP